MTGKFELEYEGELKGADQVARDLVRAAVSNVFDGYFPNADLKPMIEWFDLGGSLTLSDDTDAGHDRWSSRPRRCRASSSSRTAPASRPTRRRRCWRPASTSCSKGLYSQKKISRSEERGYHGAEGPPVAAASNSRARRC